MNDKLKELIDLAYGVAREMLLGTDDQILTTFVLLKEGAPPLIIATPWKNDAEKREAVLAIGMAIIRSEEPVVAYSMLTECWTSHYKEGEELRGRPEQDPERGEIVMCVASTGTEMKHAAWNIKRDAQGRCESLVEENEQEGVYSSWMIAALDKAMELVRFKHEALRNQRNN